MRSSLSFKIIIFASLCAVCGSGLFAYTAFKLEQRGAVLQEQMQLFEDEQTHQQEYVNVMTQLTETRDERDRLQQYLLKGDDDTVMLLSRIDQLAEALEVSLITSRLEVLSKEDRNHDVLEIGLDIEGEDEKVKEFIDALETVPYHSYITKASITRTMSEATTTPLTKSSVTLSVSLHNE